IVPTIKLHEIAKYHLDNAPNAPKMSNSIFVVAMNQAKYDGLPPDLKKVIDANSGIETSKMIGVAFDATTEPAKKLAREAGGTLAKESSAARCALDAQPAISCIVVTGNEKAFAAGADIGAMAEWDYQKVYADDYITKHWDDIRRVRKPVIAAVAGYALGGGCE